MTASIIVFAPDGLPRITPETDLTAELLKGFAQLQAPDGTTGLQDGDIVIISSKVVAKAEGRLVPEAQRAQSIAEQTCQIVAEKDSTSIVRNEHGLVLAAAGVDASNTEEGSVLLLPANPDESAARLRKELQDALGLNLGLIISDTLGRPWRLGLTDCAIGSSGVLVLEDHRGRTDAYGRKLELTLIALGDELASAADLLKSKSTQRPVAIIRGLDRLVGDQYGQDARTLVRPVEEDLFTLGTQEAKQQGAAGAIVGRRTVRHFRPEPLDSEALSQVLNDAVAAAITAPAPHHTKPWRFVFVSEATKPKLLAAMESRWRRDLADIDGLDLAQIDARVSRGRVLHEAPCLVVPCLVRDGAHEYPDARRGEAERDMFTLSGGAAIENFLIHLSTQGWASAWVSSSIFCATEVCEVLDIPHTWQPLGVIAVGKAAQQPGPRGDVETGDFIEHR